MDAESRRYSRSNPRPYIRSHYVGLKIHELRHTHFTLLASQHVDIKTIQALGGWKSPTVPLNVYIHPEEKNKRAAADLFGGVMDG